MSTSTSAPALTTTRCPLVATGLAGNGGIPVGSGISERQGRTIFLKYMTIRGTFWAFDAADHVNDALQKPTFLRFIVFGDTSHNNSASLVTLNSNLFDSNSNVAGTHRNYEPSNRQRFPVAYDKTFDLTNYEGGEIDQNSTVGRIAQMKPHHFNLRINLHNMAIQYNPASTTGPVDEMNQSIIYFGLICDNGVTSYTSNKIFQWDINTRVYFSNHLSGKPPTFRDGLLSAPQYFSSKKKLKYRRRSRMQRPVMYASSRRPYKKTKPIITTGPQPMRRFFINRNNELI